MIGRGSAPGKVILCGEHAVVYGEPAIALPVANVAATAVVRPGSQPGIVVTTPDTGGLIRLGAGDDHPLASLVFKTFEALGVDSGEPLSIVIESTIPIASGMGSGAAISAALVLAIAAYFGLALDPPSISALVYESERYYHGTPSGIDNTIVSLRRPIWYRRSLQAADARIEPVTIGRRLTLVIGDTGVRCPTRITVGAVRERWQADRATYAALFEAIGLTVEAVRTALASGDLAGTGALLARNHALLQRLGVSSEPLDRLVETASRAGAAGAKLSGGGGGGIMLALVEPAQAAPVAAALRTAGAAQVIVTEIEASGSESVLV